MNMKVNLKAALETPEVCNVRPLSFGTIWRTARSCFFVVLSSPSTTLSWSTTMELFAYTISLPRLGRQTERRLLSSQFAVAYQSLKAKMRRMKWSVGCEKAIVNRLKASLDEIGLFGGLSTEKKRGKGSSLSPGVPRPFSVKTQIPRPVPSPWFLVFRHILNN